MKSTSIKNLTLSAMFVAIGIVLPFITGQIPQIGNMLLPMHIPVLLCGLICGWRYGALVGMILPLLRSLMFTAPPLYPNAIAMAFELATYGLVIGLLYSRFRRQGIIALYSSMISAMISGRIVWGVAQVVLLGLGEQSFTWKMFIGGSLLNAIPGIIIQLILIPAIMIALNQAGLVPFKREQTNNSKTAIEG